LLQRLYLQYKLAARSTDHLRFLAVRAANTIERRLRRVANEITRESRRGAESQGGITSPESSPVVPGSPEKLPTLEEMLGLPNREVTPVEKEDLGLAGLFWLPPPAPLSFTGQSVRYL
jgi:hypothetical protein